MHIATATMYTTHSAKHLQTKASKSHVCVSAVSLDFNIRSSFFFFFFPTLYNQTNGAR